MSDSHDHGRIDGGIFGPGQPCFGCSPDHPIGFRLGFVREGADAVVCRFTPGERFQGPPGIMHGGLVATLADEVAAWVPIAVLGKFGFTVSFEARYGGAVRIGEEIVARAKLVKPGTRLVDVDIALAQGGKDCFTGRFRFVLLNKAGAEKMLGRALPPEWERFAR